MAYPAALPPPGARTFVCTHAGRKFAIQLSAEVAARLGMESRTAFNSLPHRGLEVGGILLGRIETGGDLPTYWIEGCQPIESEHRSGPSYLLSEGDLYRMEEALAKYGAFGLGIYRSQTRSEELQLQESDSELFARSFGGKDALFLLIGPVSGIAALFIPAEGVLQRVIEIPFSPNQIVPAVAVPAPPARLDKASARSSAELAAVRVRFKEGWRRTLAVAGCLLLAAAMMALWQTRRHSPTRAPAVRGSLNLEVLRVGAAVRLAWDRNSPAIDSATHGVLHIGDGSRQLDMQLTPSQLNAGSFLYAPETSDVTFRMEVYSGDPSASGFIRVVAAPLVVPPPPRVRRSSHDRRRRTASSRVRAASQPAKALAAVQSAAPVPVQASAPVGREDTRPPSSSSPERRAALAPADAPGTRESASKPPAPAASTGEPSPPEPSLYVVAEPISGSLLRRVVGKIPLVRRLKRPPKAAAATPVHEVLPSLKTREERSLVRPVAVDVKVYVGESGKVERAEVADYGNPPNWRLADAALLAAQDWDFEPARVGDVPVSSEVMLHFRFRLPYQAQHAASP